MMKRKKMKRIEISAQQSEDDKKQSCLFAHIAASAAFLDSRENPELKEKLQELQGSQETCCWRESC
jgi:hypothetical protein